MALTYSQYLKVDEILKLQDPKSKTEHDEMLFIVIHQVYELWFKQILHEMTLLNKNLNAGETYLCLSNLKRILTILKTIVGQVDILETMTPLQFASFRGLLETSSGFQSLQFRKIEFMLGHKREKMLEHFKSEGAHFGELKAVYENPTVYDAFLNHLKIKKHAVPDGLLKRNVTQPIEENLDLQKILMEIYKTDPLLSQLCERLVDLDEGLQEWRYRHVKMVERTIGVKMGTGGSPGAEYLRKTLFQPIFPDLWSIRSQF
ncbi:MAG: tryptophan 2,3-dioxygenase family protein [Bdellovibrionota bacterium]